MRHTAPLSKFPLLATDNIDEAEQKLARSLTACHITKVADKSRFGVRMNGLEFGGASLVHNSYRTGAKIESELPGDPVFFSISTGKTSTFHIGKQKSP